jgi:hypothetical protein
MIEIEVIENEEMWSQRAVDCTEVVKAELRALRQQRDELPLDDHKVQVRNVENFKESGE